MDDNVKLRPADVAADRYETHLRLRWPAAILMIVGLLFGALVLALVGTVVVFSWMAPETGVKLLDRGAWAHALALALVVFGFGLCVRLIWRIANELRGRRSRPLASERIGWMLCLGMGVPMTALWLWNLSAWSLLDLRGEVAYLGAFLLAPLIGRKIDQARAD